MGLLKDTMSGGSQVCFWRDCKLADFLYGTICQFIKRGLHIYKAYIAMLSILTKDLKIITLITGKVIENVLPYPIISGRLNDNPPQNVHFLIPNP